MNSDKGSEPTDEDLRKAFAREVEDVLARRRQHPCPTLNRWWDNALRGVPFTVDEEKHIAACDHCQRIGQTVTNAVRPRPPIVRMARQVAQWGRRHAIAASLLFVMLLGLGATGLYAYRARSALDDALAQLEAARAAIRIQRQTFDSSLRELNRGREFTRRESDKPNELVLQLSPFLGPPYYTALQVIWDAEADPEARPELVYHHGYKPLEPLIRHQYQLPDPGDQRRATAKLIYRLSGEGMARFKRGQVITETLPLVLTSKGIRVAVGRAVDAVSASIIKPTQKSTPVPEEFTLELALQAPPKSSAARTPAADRMIHVLIRPLNGPPEDQALYSVQPFTQRVSDLPEDGTQAQFDTWAALPGVVRSPVSAEVGGPVSTGPTQFEILVIELPLRLVQKVVPKAQMDFDDPQLGHDAVRARRVVQYLPNLGPQG